VPTYVITYEYVIYYLGTRTRITLIFNYYTQGRVMMTNDDDV